MQTQESGCEWRGMKNEAHMRVFLLLSCSLLFDLSTYWNQTNDTKASLPSDGEK